MLIGSGAVINVNHKTRLVVGGEITFCPKFFFSSRFPRYGDSSVGGGQFFVTAGEYFLQYYNVNVLVQLHSFFLFLFFQSMTNYSNETA